MTRFAFLLSTLLVGCASFAAHATDFAQPQPGLHTGGQPSQDDLARLKSEGVRTVIDLRGPQEDRGYDEAAAAEALGLRYVRLPIDGAAGISEANARTLDRLLRQDPGTTLLHCASGNRAGALLALVRARVQGAPVDDALRFGRDAGLTSLEPAVRAALERPAQP